MPEYKTLLQTYWNAFGRILFTVTIFVAMLFGVRAGLAALVPSDWCGGTPVDVAPVEFVVRPEQTWILAERQVGRYDGSWAILGCFGYTIRRWLHR